MKHTHKTHRKYLQSVEHCISQSAREVAKLRNASRKLYRKTAVKLASAENKRVYDTQSKQNVVFNVAVYRRFRVGFCKQMRSGSHRLHKASHKRMQASCPLNLTCVSLWSKFALNITYSRAHQLNIRWLSMRSRPMNAVRICLQGRFVVSGRVVLLQGTQNYNLRLRRRIH